MRTSTRCAGHAVARWRAIRLHDGRTQEGGSLAGAATESRTTRGALRPVGSSCTVARRATMPPAAQRMAVSELYGRAKTKLHVQGPLAKRPALLHSPMNPLNPPSRPPCVTHAHAIDVAVGRCRYTPQRAPRHRPQTAPMECATMTSCSVPCASISHAMARAAKAACAPSTPASSADHSSPKSTT
jgi:hypothetical protein